MLLGQQNLAFALAFEMIVVVAMLMAVYSLLRPADVTVAAMTGSRRP